MDHAQPTDHLFGKGGLSQVSQPLSSSTGWLGCLMQYHSHLGKGKEKKEWGLRGICTRHPAINSRSMDGTLPVDQLFRAECLAQVAQLVSLFSGRMECLTQAPQPPWGRRKGNRLQGLACMLLPKSLSTGPAWAFNQLFGTGGLTQAGSPQLGGRETDWGAYMRKASNSRQLIHR